MSGCYEGIHDDGLRGLAGCTQLETINISYLDLVSVVASVLRCGCLRFYWQPKFSVNATLPTIKLIGPNKTKLFPETCPSP